MAGLANTAPEWVRFAAWPARKARLTLALLAAGLLLALLIPIDHSGDGGARPGIGMATPAQALPPARFDDLAMYERIIARLQRGETYYVAAVAEHRATGFPLRPGIAVRLPTLALLSAWLGNSGLTIAAWALFFAVPLVWWRKLGEELAPVPEGTQLKLQAVLLAFVGVSIGLTPMLFTLHEIWAGAVLALSLGLYRPGKWGVSLIFAALALAIRELALPFVLLMAATAFWHRDWRQTAAWSALAGAFLLAMAAHLHTIAGGVHQSDLVSPSWLTFRGFSGWFSNLVLPSQLLLIPEWLAKVLVVAMLFGWASWRSRTASFAFLLQLGYGLFFMIAGRDENHYWGAVVAPVLFIGLAFAPRGALALWHAASVRKIR